MLIHSQFPFCIGIGQPSAPFTCFVYVYYVCELQRRRRGKNLQADTLGDGHSQSYEWETNENEWMGRETVLKFQPLPMINNASSAAFVCTSDGFEIDAVTAFLLFIILACFRFRHTLLISCTREYEPGRRASSSVSFWPHCNACSQLSNDVPL